MTLRISDKLIPLFCGISIFCCGISLGCCSAVTSTPVTAFTRTNNESNFKVSCSPDINSCIQKIVKECGVWGYQTLDLKSDNTTYQMIVKCL